MTTNCTRALIAALATVVATTAIVSAHMAYSKSLPEKDATISESPNMNCQASAGVSASSGKQSHGWRTTGSPWSAASCPRRERRSRSAAKTLANRREKE